MNKYYPGEIVNIHIQSLINRLQEKNWVITTKKKGNGKLLLFCDDREQVIPIYIGVCVHWKNTLGTRLSSSKIFLGTPLV